MGFTVATEKYANFLAALSALMRGKQVRDFKTNFKDCESSWLRFSFVVGGISSRTPLTVWEKWRATVRMEAGQSLTGQGSVKTLK